MPPWLEALLETLAEKFLIPNWNRIQNWFIKSPLLVSIISVVPIFGVLISYGLVLDQAKVMIFLFIDILMLFALPAYPFYKLLTAFDVWILTKRRKAGNEISTMEWFWN